MVFYILIIIWKFFKAELYIILGLYFFPLQYFVPGVNSYPLFVRVVCLLVLRGLGLYVICVLVLFMFMCLGMCVCLSVEAQRSTSGTSCLVFWVSVGWTPEIWLFTSQCWITNVHCHIRFLHGAVDQTQNLMLAQRALYQLSHLTRLRLCVLITLRTLHFLPHCEHTQMHLSQCWIFRLASFWTTAQIPNTGVPLSLP